MLALIVIAVIFLIWIGLRMVPKSFPPHEERTPELQEMHLPNGLPAPVERFYRHVYGESVPVIESAVLTGRATIRPVMAGPSLQARFVFIHRAGKAYRHYIEATVFGVPLLKVNEGYVDGKSFFESPMGTYYDDANTNQAANLALWAEAAWFPSIWITDPRVRWQPMDDNTALLYVPFETKEQAFVVRFNPKTGLIAVMEAMRYREAGKDKDKILWITSSLGGKTIAGTKLPATGAATWLDQGRPWAVFTIEDAVYNVDVSEYVRRRGP